MQETFTRTEGSLLASEAKPPKGLALWEYCLELTDKKGGALKVDK